jgi:hypothetical protein
MAARSAAKRSSSVWVARIAGRRRANRPRVLFVFGSAARDDFDPERSEVDLLVDDDVLVGTWSAAGSGTCVSRWTNSSSRAERNECPWHPR